MFVLFIICSDYLIRKKKELGLSKSKSLIFCENLLHNSPVWESLPVARFNFWSFLNSNWNLVQNLEEKKKEKQKWKEKTEFLKKKTLKITLIQFGTIGPLRLTVLV